MISLLSSQKMSHTNKQSIILIFFLFFSGGNLRNVALMSLMIKMDGMGQQKIRGLFGLRHSFEGKLKKKSAFTLTENS